MLREVPSGVDGESPRTATRLETVARTGVDAEEVASSGGHPTVPPIEVEQLRAPALVTNLQA